MTGADDADLVGWALDPPLRDNRRLSEAVTRRVLATALGVREEQLHAVDAPALQSALRRLRAMVARCETLAAAADVDDLTGALRRGSGISALQREIARARRVPSSGVVVAFVDVDGLKHVNDTLGHPAGDQLLRDVVAAMRQRVRPYDLVFRYGGDEFVCVLVDVSLEQAQRTMDDILDNVRRNTDGHTFSAGFALVAADDTAESVLARADSALYQARSSAAR